MKFSSAIAVLATTVALTASNVQGADKCTPSMVEPFTDEEYMVIQYMPKATTCLDVDDPEDAITIANAYITAYSNADEGCGQIGASCEVYFAEVVGHQKIYNHFVMRVASFCNSWKHFGVPAPNKEQCGIALYSTDSIFDDDSRKLVSTGLCDCPRPTRAQVESAFNAEIAAAVNAKCPSDSAPQWISYVKASQQLCALECQEGTSDYSYSGRGVEPPCGEVEIFGVDMFNECGDWAAMGECEGNPNFMFPNCRASCKEIGLTRSPAWAPTDDSGAEDVAAVVATAAPTVDTNDANDGAFLSPAAQFLPTAPTDDGGKPGEDDD